MINNSYLLGLYGVDTTSLGLGTTSATTAARKQPTPPWDSKAVVPKADVLVRSALAGRPIINESSATIDLAGSSADYRRLFSLYQGLETLTALADRAGVRGLTARESAQLSQRFASGLAEVSGYLTTAGFEDLRLVQGVSASTSKTTAGVARDSAKSATGPIHEGDPSAPVAAFQGEVAFDITIKRKNEPDTVVSIDLDEMGARPRTLDSVIAHINEKLGAAGVTTHFSREQIKAEPRTLNVNGRTVTLPAGADRWGLSIRGSSAETVSFSAAQTADAVYVVQGAGGGAGHELLKFQSDDNAALSAPTQGVGQMHWVDGQSGHSALPAGVEAVRASAVGPDGSLWMVADLTAGADGQPIKGQRDVALMQFDSAGRLVTTRLLGAASSAHGYALAVGDDGRVAVAGSVVGALVPGESGAAANLADSFVTVFDADGHEMWTQRRGARAADEATAVSFGPDGTVIVAGRAQSGMPGAPSLGGWDGYVQTFSEHQVHSLAPIKATASGVSQFGGAGDDNVQAMTVDGSNVYTAGVEDGRLVVRHFTLGPDGAPTLAATRDLGGAHGEVAGIAVSNGQVILSGTTRNAALDAGTVTNAHSGGTDAFVAALSADLAAGPDDRLTYFGAAGDDTVADVKVVDGKVWITGVADRAPGAKADDPTRAYLARIDPQSGAVEWSRDWSGAGQKAQPMALAVASGGASVLDRLGLPQGEIDQSDSKRLVDATALRAGDRFYYTPPEGGRAVAITIEAKDTLQTLARKIELASGRRLKVTVTTGLATGVSEDRAALQSGLQQLSITARDGKAGGVLRAGETGRDALAGLGLSPGYIGTDTAKGVLKTYGLDLPASLNLNDAASIKTASERLSAALTLIRSAYRGLSPDAAKPVATGPAPAYLQAQLANYQAALARLTG